MPANSAASELAAVPPVAAKKRGLYVPATEVSKVLEYVPPVTPSGNPGNVGTWVAALPVAGLATVGTAMRLAADAARASGCPDVATFASPEGAAAHMIARVARGDRVLVKGSRGMRMERAVDALLAGPGVRAETPRC